MEEGFWVATPGESPAREVWRRGLASAAALLFALLLGALVVLVSKSNADRDAATEAERRSFEIIMISRNIDGSIARSEAALGRYVISSDRRLGTIYRDQWRAAGRQITQLGQLVRDNPTQAALVEDLRGDYRAYGEELSTTASYASAERNWEALSLHNSAAASEHAPAIIRKLTEIADNERVLLSARSSARIAATERSNILATLLTIAGVALGLAAIALAWITVRAFSDRHSADRRAESLEDAVAERTIELERVNEELRAEAGERAAAERQLRQFQKMEAVGQLTGGIAHDFNNMLAVVVGGLDLARGKLAAGKGDVARHIDSALDGANRAAALTRRLLSFARAEPLLPEGTDPAALVAGMEDLLQRTIGAQVTVTIDCADDCWPIWVDPQQLENAVLNLAVNARDAMESKGDIRIAVANTDLDHDEIGEAPAGSYVEISVSDSGCGMTPEIVERVFEPFFTTKPVGKGTGLGLSQIFGFVRQSGGDIAIESVPDEGTTVSIYLPRFDGDATSRREPVADWSANATANVSQARVILLVEDDERVRRATVEALEELGHKPIACASAEAAIDVLAERDDIGLLISDVVMPGMTGPELVDHIAPLCPNLPVLFITGYMGEASDANQLAGRGVLRKPFTIGELAQALTDATEAVDTESFATE